MTMMTVRGIAVRSIVVAIVRRRAGGGGFRGSGDVSVVAAVQGDLRSLGVKAASSGLAETALALARELDDDSNSATSKSMCAKSMIDVLRELRLIAPPVKESDDIDDLAGRRSARRARGAAAQDSARP
jgi:hypothetical protein